MDLLKKMMICMMFALPLAACDTSDGTAENVGENIDNAAEDARDNLEEAGDNLDDAADDMTD